MFRAIAYAAVLCCLGSVGPAWAEDAAPVAIVSAEKATFPERLAAKEIRRYVYVRTGKLLPIVGEMPAAGDGALFVVGSKTQPAVKQLLDGAKLAQTADGLAAEQYLLKTFSQNNRRIVLVTGGDPVGTLYGAYRLAEHLGVRFYMHGDVVPDKPVALAVASLDETGKPLFDRRGIQPFHDFPEGPDWWDADAYKAILGQLSKMRMNFFGLHTYPPGGVGPEPLTWIGTPGQVGPEGRVKASYPSRHFVTANVTGAWGYRPMKTSDYVLGAAGLFDRDDFGADYMNGTDPWTKMSADECNALFDRMGGVLRDSFTWARRLGIKTCLGTETPLLMPDAVKKRLQAAGKNPNDPAVVQEVYEGIFERIMKTHPLDYYWFWTPEGWTWAPVSEPQIKATLDDFRAAGAAAAKVKAPFTLATCGWVLGPPQKPSLFDETLPKDMPMSCISRQVGNSPVESGFVRVQGRPKWSIPWMEDDPGMVLPQLWAGRMRRDAADSLAYGCTGLMGIHWRTRILGPNVSALAKAAWDQAGWNPDFGKKPDAAGTKKLAEGPEGGQTAHFFQNRITGTDDPVLYQTVRYDMRAYRIDVPNGVYTVTLKFCEPHYKEKGKRVFGVKLQGKTVIDRLDIFERVGQNKALDVATKDVQVTNGQLTIEFVYQVEFPSVAAIAIEGPVGTRKIDCAGQRYKEYEADLVPTGPGGKPRYLPAGDFYADWARAEFGPEAAEPIAALFTKIDCHLPRAADWVDGPGGVRPDPRPWDEVSKSYAFVDELAAFRPRVAGAGNLERFDYWLDNFRYLRAMAQVNCTWARFNAVMDKVRAEKNLAAKRQYARTAALPLRKSLVAQVAQMHDCLLATVSTYGELGNVTNWQQHNFPGLLVKPGEELAKILGEPLPADAMPAQTYAGKPRLAVPVVRTAVMAGERLKLTAIAVGPSPREIVVHWRPLGKGEFAKLPATQAARNVYRATLPAEAVQDDLEYYLEASLDTGTTLRWPATAPALNQSVVVVKE